MVYLDSIRLRGFKTFARPTELSLEPGVTVIIGPNGSGKSNIADAVLWVLGEQSPGNLRGRTMQDVIFSGPDGRRASALAEVSLVFDNEGGVIPLDSNQVEVTRRLLRDSASEYRLNGSVCRLLDVQDLFGGLGLGREMHSVVSQGKVDAVLNSTPEARRALVEEAAGLGRFKKRRERTRAKLERTRQNLLRVADIEREVKHSLRPLRQQVAAAERFAQATEEWALAKARLLLLELLEAERLCKASGDSLSSLLAKRADVEGRLAALRRQRSDEEQRFTDALHQREELGAAYHRVRGEADRLEARALDLRQRVARNEGELDRASRRRELAEGQLASLRARAAEAELPSADESRLAVVTGVALRAQADLDMASPAYREALAREDDVKDEVFELEAAHTRAVQDRDFLRRESEEKGRLWHEVGQAAEAAALRLEDLRSQAEDLRRRCADGDAAVSRARGEAAEALQRRDAARAAAEEAGREERHIGELLAGLASRREVLGDLLQRREGLPTGARALMEGSSGVKLLTEVLNVEPGYERALAAALGSMVQAVVVDETCDAATALSGGGPVEVVWEAGAQDGARDPGRDRGAEMGTPSALPEGFCDLWEVVTGPEPVLRGLRRLVGPTAVLSAEKGSTADLGTVAGADGWRLVTRGGEVVTLGVHAARRTEAGAEALLRARNELQAVSEEEGHLAMQREQALMAAETARAAANEADEAHHMAEQSLREAEREALGAKNEADLHTRRLGEVEAQVAELQARSAKEEDLASQLRVDLERSNLKIAEREKALEDARADLRALQGELEVARRRVAAIEEKKAQAALLEVRLRERCRAHEAERERARAQRDAAAADAAGSARRVELLSAFHPALLGLLGYVERLAQRTRRIAEGLETRVEESRARSDEAAQVMRERGGAETALQRDYDDLSAQVGGLQVDQARADDRRALLETELAELKRRHMAPRALAPADVAGADLDSLQVALQRAEQRRDRIGPVNPLAEQECAEMEERAAFLSEQRRDLEASLAQLQDVISGLEEHINTAFTEIFAATRENFQAVIATIFPGAKGTLALVEAKKESGTEGANGEDAPDEGTESEADQKMPGISLSVKFPNKAPRSMSLLSGGEKAMTAIAFLFSLFLARPCPFYILDEVEASLDDINIRRFLSLVRRYRDKTQFIIITHQRQTMEIADTLYGVALESDGTSRVLSRRLGGRKHDTDHADAATEAGRSSQAMVKEA